MAKTNAEATFRAKAPFIMSKLLGDFSIGPEDAAAIVGNLGHECGGFTQLQELKPVVAGSRGGYGWAQWTGPRRRSYEAYCKRTGKDPASDEANYAYLWIELKGIEGSEGQAIAKTVAAKGLDAKVEAFEKAFLRAGVKHYPSRKKYAGIALAAWQIAGKPVVKPTQTATGKEPEPIKPKVPISVAVLALALLVGAFLFFTLPIFPR
ncbi:phage tail tip lysozyme [Devosia sp. MC1541]|uniref:phage tail tip lysozyme n=1 Tax=Devosia sp. MC1541 TaxID=2725264 RepID=UPI00145E8DC8|nr:phage tail tip lysozyme [Devosia sp. MC1541]